MAYTINKTNYTITMFTNNEKEKISKWENKKNRKLTRDELEIALDRDISDTEWEEYINPQPSAPVEEPSVPERTYKIVKITKKDSLDGNIIDTEWQIVGEVDLFQLKDVFHTLLDTIMRNKSSSSAIRILFTSTRTNKEGKTKLIGSTKFGFKDGVVSDLFNNLEKFLEYEDFDIEEVIFKVIEFKEPKGAGRVNKIISIKDKKVLLRS